MLALCVDDERLGLEALKRAVSRHKDYACCIRILPSYSVQAMNITPSAP